MSETDNSAAITSSADRMVGMDHAEVRYFTRYVLDTFNFYLLF
jgi:protein arginine N-methyltransferase 1